MTVLKQSVFIILSFAFVGLWEITLLSAYTLPLLGGLILLYFLLSFIRGKTFHHIDNGGTPSVLVLNTAILLFIFTTGGLHSPLFFLFYFLLFGVAFVFEPLVVFAYVLCVTALFAYQIPQGDVTSNLITLAALYLISPLAYFFGKEYKTRTQQDQKIEELIEDPATPEKEKEDLQEILEDR